METRQVCVCGVCVCHYLGRHHAALPTPYVNSAIIKVMREDIVNTHRLHCAHI